MTRDSLLVVAATALFTMSGPARGEGTSLVYTYGGAFSLAIPANSGETRGWMQDAVVFVPGHLLIVDLDVLVNIRHTAAFDLQMLLRGPSGQTVILRTTEPREGYFKGENYTQTRFDDEAAVAIEDGSPPFTGSFRPFQALAAFDGRDACGVWSLRIYDAHYGDVGCLDSFVLIVTGSPMKDSVTVPAPGAGALAFLGLAVIRSLRRL